MTLGLIDPAMELDSLFPQVIQLAFNAVDVLYKMLKKKAAPCQYVLKIVKLGGLCLSGNS